LSLLELKYNPSQSPISLEELVKTIGYEVVPLQINSACPISRPVPGENITLTPESMVKLPLSRNKSPVTQ